MSPGGNSLSHDVGLAVLDVKMTRLADDFGKLERELAAHRKDHQREERRRVKSRRWLIGAALVIIASIDGPLFTVLLHLH